MKSAHANIIAQNVRNNKCFRKYIENFPIADRSFDWKEENRLKAVFKFYAPTRGGAKEARLRASLDSPQPEGEPSGHPDKVQPEAADYTTNFKSGASRQLK